MYAVLPFQHFRALIALDSMEALEVAVRKYLKMDLYDQDGEIMHNANLYYALCAELILGKKENAGSLYFNEYLDFVSTMSEGRRKNTQVLSSKSNGSDQIERLY